MKDLKFFALERSNTSELSKERRFGEALIMACRKTCAAEGMLADFLNISKEHNFGNDKRLGRTGAFRTLNADAGGNRRRCPKFGNNPRCAPKLK